MTPQETIASFAELKENWDSYGGAAIDPKQRALAMRLMEAIANVRPCPTADGGVGFEFEFGDVTVICKTVSATAIEWSIYGDNMLDTDFTVNISGEVSK